MKTQQIEPKIAKENPPKKTEKRIPTDIKPLIHGSQTYLTIEDIIDASEKRLESDKPKDNFKKVKNYCRNENFKVCVIDSFSSDSDIKECFNYLMSITLIAYHAIKDEKGRATFIMISTKKYGFIFYMNENWE